MIMEVNIFEYLGIKKVERQNESYKQNFVAFLRSTCE